MKSGQGQEAWKNLEHRLGGLTLGLTSDTTVLWTVSCRGQMLCPSCLSPYPGPLAGAQRCPVCWLSGSHEEAVTLQLHNEVRCAVGSCVIKVHTPGPCTQRGQHLL